MLILIFIGTSLTAFITSCLADNDPNPYCSGDIEKIQELTEDFLQKYGEGVEIRWDKDTGYLEKILYFNLSGFGDFKDRAFSFLSENSSFLGIDVNDLEFLSVSGLEKVTFKQLYKGLPVHEGKIWFSLAKEGGTEYSITLKKYYFCLDIDVIPTITKEEAAAIVMGNLGVTELFNAEEKSVSGWGNSAYIPYGAVMYGPSPGVYPGIVDKIMKFMGKDVVIQAGGGIHGHPHGTREGAIAMRQAVDATLKGISLKEYAKSHEELFVALQKWGE